MGKATIETIWHLTIRKNGLKHDIHNRFDRQRVGDHRTSVASKEKDLSAKMDKARNLKWRILSIEEWLQLG